VDDEIMTGSSWEDRTNVVLKGMLYLSTKAYFIDLLGRTLEKDVWYNTKRVHGMIYGIVS